VHFANVTYKRLKILTMRKLLSLILLSIIHFQSIAQAPSYDFVLIDEFNFITTNAKSIFWFKDDIYCASYDVSTISLHKWKGNNNAPELVSTQTVFGSGLGKLQAKTEGNKIFVAFDMSTELACYAYDVDLETWSGQLINIVTIIEPSWELSVKNEIMYVGAINSSNQAIVFYVNTTTPTIYGTSNYTLDLGVSSISSQNYRVLLYTSSTELYFGITAGDPGSAIDKLGKTPLTNLAAFSGYHPGGYEFQLNGVNSADFFAQLYGDGINEPSIILSDIISSATYDVPLSNTLINIATGSNIPFVFYDSDYEGITVTNTYAFMLASSSAAGGSVATDDNFLRKSLPSGEWEINTGNFQAGVPFTSFIENSIQTSLNENKAHIGFQFKPSSGSERFQVSNKLPELGTFLPSNNICTGGLNQIVQYVNLYNDDVDSVWIDSIWTASSNLNNPYSTFLGTEFQGGIKLFKYAIFGDEAGIPGGSYQLNFRMKDRFGVNTTNLNYLVAGTPNSVSFTSPTIEICQTSTEIDLSNYVNQYTGGNFFANGIALPNTTFDANPNYWNSTTNGLLMYKAFTDGCYSEVSANYTIVELGTLQVITTPAACGTATGTAGWLYSPFDDELVVQNEWSTGESSSQLPSTISGLTPQQYFCEIKLDNGCKIREYGVIEPSGLIIAPVVSDVSCFGSNDGSIDLSALNSIMGITPATILWSNGYSGDIISNLEAGSYTATITDLAGCTAISTFVVNQPEKLVFNLNLTQPTCINADGEITGTSLGGNLPHTYQLNGGTTVSSISFNGLAGGVYYLNVIDVAGCQYTETIVLNDLDAASIASVVTNQTCSPNSGSIVVNVTPSASFPFPVMTYEWENGDISQNRFGLNAGEYVIDVTSGPDLLLNTCHSYAVIHVSNELPMLQDICIVTVDTATTSNLVIWERVQDTTQISQYNIYRETHESGEFLQIDAVSANLESIFNDVIANPMISSYRYRISAVNHCGIEGPLSFIHKTLLMNSINISGTSSTIAWDDYEGTSDINNYTVWRHTDQNGWEELLPAVPIGVSVFNDNTIPVGATNLDYYVALNLNSQCTSEKAQDFNTIRSNREKGSHFAGQGTGDESNDLEEFLQSSIVAIFPNPVSEFLTIQSLEDNLSFEIKNSIGQTLSQGNINHGDNQFEVVGLSSGLYFITITSNTEEKTISFIKK
jgi:hypothetical protein